MDYLNKMILLLFYLVVSFIICNFTKNLKVIEMYTKEIIKDKLSTDVRWINRSLIVLYGFQTEDEQNIEETTEKNGQGFNGRDGKILSSFSKQLLNGRQLSTKQIDVCKRLLPKYWKQISNCIESHKNN